MIMETLRLMKLIKLLMKRIYLIIEGLIKFYDRLELGKNFGEIKIEF